MIPLMIQYQVSIGSSETEIELRVVFVIFGMSITICCDQLRQNGGYLSESFVDLVCSLVIRLRNGCFRAVHLNSSSGLVFTQAGLLVV